MRKDDALKLLAEYQPELIRRFGMHLHLEDLTVTGNSHIL